MENYKNVHNGHSSGVPQQQPMNKTLRHKSTRPNSNLTLPAKRLVLTCYHGTASLSCEVRTMAYFTLLATGKTLTHQLTVLWGDTVWLPNLTLISYHSWCHQTRFCFHALYDNITSLFTHHQLLCQVFSNYAMSYTPSCSSRTTFSCHVPANCSPGTTTTHRKPQCLKNVHYLPYECYQM
jgi:hypothetical protein